MALTCCDKVLSASSVQCRIPLPGGLMRLKVAILCVALTAAVGCKKSTAGGGGGGGGWLVGREALMQNITPEGVAKPYDLGTTETLNGIACRYSGEAWVVGSTGTLLYTNDGGKSWS